MTYTSFEEAANHSEKLLGLFSELKKRFPSSTSEASILTALQAVSQIEGNTFPTGIELMNALRKDFPNNMGDVDIDSLTFAIQNYFIKQEETPQQTDQPAQDK